MSSRIQRIVDAVIITGINKVLFGGVEAKVRRIIGMIHDGARNPKVKRIAKELTESIGSERNYLAEIRNIFEWGRDHIAYVRQPRGKDVFQPVEVTLAKGSGDCEDFTILLGAIALNMGYPLKVRIAGPDGINWRHVYPVIGYPPKSPSHWVPVDPTIPEPFGSETKVYRYKRDYNVRREHA